MVTFVAVIRMPAMGRLRAEGFILADDFRDVSMSLCQRKHLVLVGQAVERQEYRPALLPCV